MSYAVIDFCESKSHRIVKQIYSAEELDIFLPNFREKKSNKYAKKVLKILNNFNIKKIVVSKELIKNRIFCDTLSAENKSVIIGKNMYKSLILRVIKDIAFQMNVEIKKLRIVMLVNEYSAQNIDLIQIVAKEVKALTVVTSDKNKFDMLIKDLFNEYGIITKVVEKNNINFKKVDVLINVDFSDYELNKITISNNSVIICGFVKQYTAYPNFDGIIINDIDVIDFSNENKNIDDLALCEAKIYTYLRKLKENDRTFEREGFRINGYIGQNGKIRAEEFKNLGKKLLDK